MTLYFLMVQISPPEASDIGCGSLWRGYLIHRESGGRA